jgi:hypothetical protein
MVRPKMLERDARSARLNLRLLPDERAELDQRAAALGLTPSDYARRLATGSRVAAVTARRADPALVLALNRIGVNLNQIARAANSDGGRFAGFQYQDLAETLVRINQFLDRLQGSEE